MPASASSSPSVNEAPPQTRQDKEIPASKKLGTSADSKELSAVIASEIRTSGPLTFARFMDLALYHPELGYYGSGKLRVGRRGDFLTSVSYGPALGIVLAAQFEEMWVRLGSPDSFAIVEQGANDGLLARDILRALHPPFSAAVRYQIVEPFPQLAARQRETLRENAAEVTWHDALESLPPFAGVHFSNELVDAFPFHLLRVESTGWKELFVEEAPAGRISETCKRRGFAAHGTPVAPGRRDPPSAHFGDAPTPEGFQFASGPPSEPVTAEILRLGTQPEGTLVEVRPSAAAWIRGISEKLLRGYVLTIDYGVDRDRQFSRKSGTFACYHAHQRDELPLEKPGQKDITAHVDFFALEEAGIQAGLVPVGLCDQTHFLVGASEPLLRALEGRPDAPLWRGLKPLLHPESMGAVFHAFCMSTPMPESPPLSGFRHARKGTINENRILGGIMRDSG